MSVTIFVRKTLGIKRPNFHFLRRKGGSPFGTRTVEVEAREKARGRRVRPSPIVEDVPVPSSTRPSFLSPVVVLSRSRARSSRQTHTCGRPDKHNLPALFPRPDPVLYFLFMVPPSHRAGSLAARPAPSTDPSASSPCVFWGCLEGLSLGLHPGGPCTSQYPPVELSFSFL